MKSFEFNKAVSDIFIVPLKTVTTYTRFLKEDGLLTTGARGVNAPHMTGLDAARVIIALLASDGPSQAAERVRRFGVLRYRPDFEKSWPHYKNIGTDRFNEIFEGKTLEDVLAFLFNRFEVLGIGGGSKYFTDNVFGLRIDAFDVLAELSQWETEDGMLAREIVAPFKGDPYDNNYPKIINGIRTTREVTPISISAFSLSLSTGASDATS